MLANLTCPLHYTGLGDNAFVRMVREFATPNVPQTCLTKLHATVEARVRTIMRNLHTAIHDLPLEPWFGNAIQDHRHLSDLRKNQERVSNVPVGPRVWAAHAGPRYRACDQE